MKTIKELMSELGLENKITLEDIPSIDLYMDQVTQLFENKFRSSKRYEQDKVLTKTMINNYAKGKLLFPIKNKKYTKEHLILIVMIYQLKGALSIKDVKIVLDQLNDSVESETVDLDSLYTSYLDLMDNHVGTFKQEIAKLEKTVTEKLTEVEDRNSTYLENLLLISSLVNISNMYRRLAEKLVDQMNVDMEK